MRSGGSTGSLTFVGTATTIIRFGELTLLTDPNFLHRGQRAHLGYGLSSKRLTEPALSIAELPELDAILLSHLHGDHWDRVANRGLDHDLPVLTTPHAARRLQWRGFPRAIGIRTWTAHRITKGNTTATITALPGRHAPGWTRRLLPPVMGTMLELGTVSEPARQRVYISGDTLLVEELKQIPERFPDIDTGVLHLGGTTLPGGLVVTMDARQGAGAVELIGAGTNIPIHYDDYSVFRSSLADFRAEVDRRGLSGRVRYVARGDTVPLVRPD